MIISKATGKQNKHIRLRVASNHYTLDTTAVFHSSLLQAREIVSSKPKEKIIRRKRLHHNLPSRLERKHSTTTINRFSWPRRGSFPGLYPAHQQSSQASSLCHDPEIDHGPCPGSGTGHGPCPGPGTGHGLYQLGNRPGC